MNVAGERGSALEPGTARIERLDSGTLLFHGGAAPSAPFETIGSILERQAATRGDRTFLAERAPQGWRRLSFGEAWETTGRLAKGLLETGCGADRPLLVLSENSIESALFGLAAMRTGIPVAPVSASYASFETLDRLRHVAELSGAGAVYAGPNIPERARSGLASWGIALVDAAAMANLPASSPKVSVAQEQVGPQSVAKLMFTSGSTGMPKAVINTHEMLWVNQVQLASVLPPRHERAPTFVDWLPWSHTFGGNFVFNMALWHGGTLYIDDGRPAPGAIARTIAAMAEIAPTRYFNVPAGLMALLPLFEQNREMAHKALRNLEFIFCAAAALPQAAYDRWTALLEDVCGRPIPLIGGWGATETAPCATVVHFPNSVSANIGAPLPGVTLKMVPEAERYELRVKGPNVTPGYWRSCEATEAAFDEEGFYRIGDAGKFVDPERPHAGIAFDGRIAENFKLVTGTWVNVGKLRLALIDAGKPYVRDAVITGHDRAEIGALLFLDEEAVHADFGIAPDAATSGNAELREFLRRAIAGHNAASGMASSTRVSRFGIEDRPPSLAAGELTDKGYLNQRAVRDNRSEAVAQLYCGGSARV